MSDTYLSAPDAPTDLQAPFSWTPDTASAPNVAGPFQVAGGLGAVGSLLKGITSWVSQGRQATAYDREALQTSEEHGVDAQEALQQGDAVAAQAAVGAAAHGGGLTGSSIGLIQNLSSQAMFNARNQIYRGNVERQNDLYEAGVQRANSKLSLAGGIVGAASSVIGGFAGAAAAQAGAGALSAVRGLDYGNF